MTLEGTSLRTYRIGPELGRGAMGVVHRAVTTRAGPAGPSGTAVAVKVLHPGIVADAAALERFRLEARIGREVHHPNLVRLYEFGRDEVDGVAVEFLAMELIEGASLEGIREQQERVPEDVLGRVANGVALALAAIHDRGIVHRDVKPGNVVLAEGRGAILMDFGIAARTDARRTQSDVAFTGSMPYAAPEQFAGEPIGPRADLYALGVMLFELTTGAHPFEGMSVAGIANAKLEGNVPSPRDRNPDLSPLLSAVIETCMHRSPMARFPSARALLDALAEGEASDWWRHRRAGDTAPRTERALRRLATDRRTPLIGRDDEHRVLHDATRRGTVDGGVVLIEGTTGLGKTRLLEEQVRRIAGAGGPMIAIGRGAGTGQRAFGPLLDAVADLPTAAEPPERLAAFLAGSIQPGPDSGLSKEALNASLVDWLRAAAAERPLVLVFDDLHLAGDETTELIRHLAPRLAGSPILLLAAYDVDAVAADSSLGALAHEDAGAHGYVRLPLAPLAVVEAETLIRHVVGHERTVRDLLAALHAKSEGNPLIMLEVLAHLESSGALRADGTGLGLATPVGDIPTPATLGEVIALKLTHLDEEPRELLEVAAILGPEFEASVLADVLEDGTLGSQLEALEREHGLVIDAGSGRFRFARYQVYEAIYDGMAPALRAEYHEVVADALLQGEVVEGEQAYALLRHLLLADRALEAAPFLEQALAHMAASFHATFAAPMLEKVAQAYTQAPAEKRLALAMTQWAFYDRLARRADQLRVLDVAHEMASAKGDPGPRARVHGLRAGSYWYAGDYDRALEEAEAGLACATEAGDRTWEATCLHTIGVVAFRHGELQRCAELWRRALAIRREIDDRKGQASTLQALSLILPSIGEGDQVLETMEASLALWRSIGERRGEASMLMNIGNHLIDAARYEEGLEHLERALAGHRDTGAVTNETLTLTNLGRAQHAIGRIDDARRSWEQALELFLVLENPNGEMATRLNLGGALWMYGEHQEADEQLHATIALAERLNSPTHHIMALRDLGALRHALGDRRRAWEVLERALALETELGSTTSRIDTALAAAHVALHEGDAARATALLEPVLDEARADATRAPLTLLRLARAHAAAGRAQTATAMATEALGRMEQSARVSQAEGPELYFTLFELLPQHGQCDGFLRQAHAYLDERAGQIRTDAYREHFLTQIWPNPQIRSAIAATD